MRTFEYQRATSVADAVARAAGSGGTYLAGGTNLVDLMKTGAAAPEVLVDIGRLGLDTVTEAAGRAVLIGAGATNSVVANHRLIRSGYPVLSQAILSGATTQLRNMATAGGNLVQRTRCPYFMDASVASCDKRAPGSGCAARHGSHREHAILGAGNSCVAVHPSDMAVALAMLDARVLLAGPAGRRTVALCDFLRLPGDDPRCDNTLEPFELITGIELPPSPFAENSWYLKVRDRHSYAFALVSVAAGLSLRDGVITAAGLALGGVAAKPWRVRAAEAALVGRTPGASAFDTAARLALHGAQPLPQNSFKVDLAKHAIVRALTRAATTPK